MILLPETHLKQRLPDKENDTTQFISNKDLPVLVLVQVP